MYWNLLKSSKNSSQMYFCISNLPKDDTKRAVIISSKLMEQKMNSQQKNCCVTMKFENEDDWEGNHQQLMAFLGKLYNFNNDEIDEDDYDEHPFKIYQIEPDDLDKVLKGARRGNVKYCIIEDIEEMDWDNEFLRMKEYVCQLFNLKDHNKLSFVNDDNEMLISRKVMN